VNPDSSFNLLNPEAEKEIGPIKNKLSENLNSTGLGLKAIICNSP